MIRRLLLPLLLVGSLVMSGCYSVTYASDSANPVLVNGGAGGYHFHEENRVYFYFWGLLNSDPDAVSNMIRPHAAHAIRGLNVTNQLDFVSYLVAAVTFGIVSSEVVDVDGNEE